MATFQNSSFVLDYYPFFLNVVYLYKYTFKIMLIFSRKQFHENFAEIDFTKKTQNFSLNVSEKISITTKETKPEGQYSKVSQVQFEKVQRKMVNGMVQLLLQVLMAKLKMNDGIWDKKCEIKRLILSMNVNFYYLIIANWVFFMASKIICRARHSCF